jgi:hypothetical protein
MDKPPADAAEGARSPPDYSVLRHFLAASDVPCPSCGYNLRGLTRDICPECGARFEIGLVNVPPRFGYLLALLAGCLVMVALPVFALVELVVFGPEFIRQATNWSDHVTWLAGAAEGAAVIVLYRRRAWFLRRRPRSQFAAAVAAWVLNLALIGALLRL